MTPRIKVPIKFGLIGSGILILMFFIFHFTGSNPLLKLPTLSVFVLPVFLFFGIKEYRDSYNQRLLEFREGMTSGFLIYVTIAVIYSLFLLLILNMLDGAEIIQEFISTKLADLDGNKMKLIDEFGENNFNDSLESVKRTTSIDLAADNFLKKIGIGFLLTSMISIILKRKSAVTAK